MKNISFVATLLCLLGETTASNAQSGFLDLTFSIDGKLTTSFYNGAKSNGTSLAVQNDGKIIVAANVYTASEYYVILSRYLPSGILDFSFDDHGISVLKLPNKMLHAEDLRLFDNGKILLSAFLQDNSGAVLGTALFKLNINGSRDTTFGNADGLITTNQGSQKMYPGGLAIQGDDKILLAGCLQDSSTLLADFCVRRYMPNGDPDFSFGGNGTGVKTVNIGELSSSAEDICLQPDGGIVTAGWAFKNGYTTFLVSRLNPDGSLDPSFNGSGISFIDITNEFDAANSLALQPDGKIVVVGNSEYHINGVYFKEVSLIRLNPNGQLDQTFGAGDGMETLGSGNRKDSGYSLCVQPDGKILIGGSTYVLNGPGTADCLFLRTNKDGILDSTFNGTGIIISSLFPDEDRISKMAIQSDGKLLITGDAIVDIINGDYQYNMLLARFNLGLMVGTKENYKWLQRTYCYPNPLHRDLTLEYELVEPQDIEINVLNSSGGFIQNISPLTAKSMGIHIEHLTCSPSLLPGQYTLSIESKQGKIAIPVIIY